MFLLRYSSGTAQRLMDPPSALVPPPEGKPAEGADASPLELHLLDLTEAKQALEPRDPKQRSAAGLSPAQFVAEFGRLCGEEKAPQLSQLFMRIDCNSDGRVTWDEFLSYVMLQDTSRARPLPRELAWSKFAPQEPSAEPAPGQVHRDAISHVLHLPKAQSYVTCAADSTLRVWHACSLRPLGSITLSDRAVRAAS